MEVNNSQDISLQNATENSEFNLLDVNDDCLLKVFSHLNIIDLINVAETCTKFKSVTQIELKKHKNFHMWDYNCYKHKDKQPMSLAKIFNHIAPYIISFVSSLGICGRYIYEWNESQDDSNLGRSLQGMNFTKLKSLDIDDSNLLKWINSPNLEELKIRHINGTDLHNFTSGLNTLKTLRIGRLHEDMSSNELKCFLEKNPNIESLEFYVSFPPQFPYNVLSQLRNLMKLSLVIDKFEPDWCSFLQIDKLTDLKVEFVEYTNSLPLFIYLENLAKKKTLKKLELIWTRFYDKAFNIIEELDVTKLRILSPKGWQPFSPYFSNITLTSLTHLDIMSPITNSELFRVIENSKNLERLRVSCMQKFTDENFLHQISHLFFASTSRRPTLTLSSYSEKDHVLIYFHICHYRIITYPSADLKQWDGEAILVERSMFSSWFDRRLREQNQMVQVYAQRP